MSHYSIKDGKGTGQMAKVDSEGRLWGYATTEPEELHTNRLNKDSYLAYTDVTPVGGGDYFFYLKNNDSRELIIQWYRIWTESSAEAIDIIRQPTGTPAGTSAANVVSANFGSTKTADVDAYEGTNITGLSGGSTFDRLRLSGDGKDVVDLYPGGIVLPQGSVIAFSVLNGAIPIEFTISFYFTKLGLE